MSTVRPDHSEDIVEGNDFAAPSTNGHTPQKGHANDDSGLGTRASGLHGELFATPESERTLVAALESVLFVADGPVPILKLQNVLQASQDEVRRAIATLERECAGRGVRLFKMGDQVQFVTAPDCAPHVERLLGIVPRNKLSAAALETLAIIAYKQPITRGAIERVRGVNCDRAIATLLARDLITEVGRADTLGHPVLFGTTFTFLEQFGLPSLEHLPPLDLAAMATKLDGAGDEG